jgi:hypothetical protein
MSLELILGDGVDVRMGIAVRLPLVGCCAIELVCSKKDLLTIRALLLLLLLLLDWPLHWLFLVFTI